MQEEYCATLCLLCIQSRLVTASDEKFISIYDWCKLVRVLACIQSFIGKHQCLLQYADSTLAIYQESKMVRYFCFHIQNLRHTSTGLRFVHGWFPNIYSDVACQIDIFFILQFSFVVDNNEVLMRSSSGFHKGLFY